MPDDHFWTVATGVAEIVGAICVMIGVVYGSLSLRAMVRTNELSAAIRFLDEVASTVPDRNAIMQEIDLFDDLAKLRREDEAAVQRVLNFFNRVALLMDKKLLPPKFVMSIFHTAIIRCCYVLQPYIEFQESRIGGRYGRKLVQLMHRAQLYHDCDPRHRVTKVKLFKKGLRNGEVIYETKRHPGLTGAWQRVYWFYIRVLRRY
ncbi:MAG: hypothetical protein QM770_01930 [Tepidisphaeraceae bacterium]